MLKFVKNESYIVRVKLGRAAKFITEICKFYHFQRQRGEASYEPFANYFSTLVFKS